MSRPVRMIVCVNERLGTGQRSCVGSGSLALIEKLETMIQDAGLNVPVVRRECLGRCEEGPVMRIAPAGPFFCELSETGLDQLMTELRTFVADRHD